MNREELLRSARNLYENPGTNEALKVVLEETFPELKESEDERIRKWLIEMVEELRKANPTNAEHNGNCSEAIAYLEKQKEQNLIPKFKVGDRIYDKRDSYNRNVIREVGKDYYINAFAQKMDMAYTDANFEFIEHLDNDLIDSKPAEWSEEDEKTIDEICCNLDYLLHNTICAEQTKVNLENRIKWLIRLKSLRPQPRWKPSEEQMDALKSARYMMNQSGDYYDTTAIIDSLITDLQNYFSL